MKKVMLFTAIFIFTSYLVSAACTLINVKKDGDIISGSCKNDGRQVVCRPISKDTGNKLLEVGFKYECYYPGFWKGPKILTFKGLTMEKAIKKV